MRNGLIFININNIEYNQHITIYLLLHLLRDMPDITRRKMTATCNRSMANGKSGSKINAEYFISRPDHEADIFTRTAFGFTACLANIMAASCCQPYAGLIWLDPGAAHYCPE